MGHFTAGPGNSMSIPVKSVETLEPLLRILSCRMLADNVAPDSSFLWVYSRLGDVSRIEFVGSLVMNQFVTKSLGENGPGLNHVTLEVAKTETHMETPKANRLHEVDCAEYDQWTMAFV